MASFQPQLRVPKIFYCHLSQIIVLWLDHFYVHKNKLVSLDWSGSSGAINVEVDGSVTEKN